MPYRTAADIPKNVEALVGGALEAAKHEFRDKPNGHAVWSDMANFIVKYMWEHHKLYVQAGAVPDLGPQSDVVFKVYVVPYVKDVKFRVVVA